MVSIFSYCIYILSKYNTNSIIKLFSLLYFAFYPAHHIFCVSMDKNTLFSGFCLLFVLNMFEIINSFKNNKNANSLNIVLAVLSVILMLLLRHNAFYAYILVLPLFYNIFKNKKKIFLFLLIPILFNILFIGVKKLYNIQPPQIASYLAIPLQQMAYVRMVKEHNLEEDEMLSFRNIVSENNELNYNPFDVDSIKLDGFNFINPYDDNLMLHSDFIQKSVKENPKNFIGLYFKWMKKYPKEYINAFILQTYYAWYPFAKWSEANIANRYIIPLENAWDFIAGIPIYRYNMLPNIRKKYTEIFNADICEKNPLKYMLITAGSNTCLNIFLFFIVFFKKRYDVIISSSIIFILFLTVLIGPVMMLRYVYQNFLILPLLFAACFSDFKLYDLRK